MQRERLHNVGGGGGGYYHFHQPHHYEEEEEEVVVDRMSPEYKTTPISFSSSSSSSSSSLPLPLYPPPSSSDGGGHSYIEHRITKMDTLAGVAIKYGVEVVLESDASNLIKRIGEESEDLSDIGNVLADCKLLKGCFRYFELSHVRREGNKCAHVFARHGTLIDSEEVWLEDEPVWASSHLLLDVADIKRLNGLVTDLQMFALKSLHIPLPGRHPPSPCLSNGLDNEGSSNSDRTPPRRRHNDLFESFQSLKLTSSQRSISSAMNNLQGFYGLKHSDQKTASEGNFEMALYRKGNSHYLEDGLLDQSSGLSNPPLSRHRKCKSVANGFWLENIDLADDMAVAEAREGNSDKWKDKLTRRRQKSEADFSCHTPEKLLEDNSNVGGFSAITGKGLALRPKAANRNAASGVDASETGGLLNPVIPIVLGDSLAADRFFGGVRKSSSTPSFQDQDNNNSASSSSMRPASSRWSLRPDLHSLSTATITKPIFDGLPNPITGRRNKAAID